MKWDEVVHVACVGSGIGSMAGAIAAADAGLDVFVADGGCRDDAALSTPVTVRPRVSRLHQGFAVDVVDLETNEYFHALTNDIPLSSHRSNDVTVPVRIIDDAPADVNKRVQPFLGSRLRDWAGRCLSSPYGVMFSRVGGRKMTTMRTKGGESVEVALLGSLGLDTDLVSGTSLADWLTAQASDRGINVLRSSRLQRIVFEDGEPVGVVVDTPAGPYAVRARSGVAVALGGSTVDTPFGHGDRPDTAVVQVGIVSQSASRFGRVELLTTKEPFIRPASKCRVVNQRFHADMRTTHMSQLHVPRCRELYGRSAFGE